MKKIEGKIEALEKVIFDEFKWETTQINPDCLTKTERELFNYMSEAAFPKTRGEIFERGRMLTKEAHYLIRRGLDFFMKTMRIQLADYDEMLLFWLRFTDFMHETMYILNRNRGTDILAEIILGENSNNWPAEEDQKWKELKEAEHKWNRDFKEYWEYLCPTMEKLFDTIIPKNQREEGIQQEEIESTYKPKVSFESRFQRFFGEIISIWLSYPLKIEVYFLVMLSISDKTKTLLEIIKNPSVHEILTNQQQKR